MKVEDAHAALIAAQSAMGAAAGTERPDQDQLDQNSAECHLRNYTRVEDVPILGGEPS